MADNILTGNKDVVLVEDPLFVFCEDKIRRLWSRTGGSRNSIKFTR